VFGIEDIPSPLLFLRELRACPALLHFPGPEPKRKTPATVLAVGVIGPSDSRRAVPGEPHHPFGNLRGQSLVRQDVRLRRTAVTRFARSLAPEGIERVMAHRAKVCYRFPSAVESA
jgi:hypothetical protein